MMPHHGRDDPVVIVFIKVITMHKIHVTRICPEPMCQHLKTHMTRVQNTCNSFFLYEPIYQRVFKIQLRTGSENIRDLNLGSEHKLVVKLGTDKYEF
jgi:hypothetical protein